MDVLFLPPIHLLLKKKNRHSEAIHRGWERRGYLLVKKIGADPRSLVLRALETVEEVGSHLRLTEILVRALAQLDVEEADLSKSAKISGFYP